MVWALFGLCTLSAQTTDLARLEYTLIPQANSDNSINRFRGFVNFPIPLEWDGSYLVPGLEYRNVDLDIEDPVPFDIKNVQKFQMFRLSMGYTFKMSEAWRVGMKVGVEIASNFEQRTAKGSDLRFTGAGYFNKRQNPPILLRKKTG